ncbi:MAG: helix-turn-helix transcriptional regulator [Myxococcales bacterium]|nr:helix-turn-helix transcriptional regulator [Myxococcales bacterium]
MRATYACPVELALDVLGGKWRAVILARIKEGTERYADLRRLVPRMSEKMLSQRLHELVGAGLVQRRGAAYVLTARGESARKAMDALYAWGEALASELGVQVEPPARARQGRA